MKKLKRILIMMVVMALCACSHTKAITPATGTYCTEDSDVQNGPAYMVTIDTYKNQKMTFEVVYLGMKASPLYMTDSITVNMKNNQTETFTWHDSWDNEGTGHIVFNGERELTITMEVTKESETNRASLAIKDTKLTWHEENNQ